MTQIVTHASALYSGMQVTLAGSEFDTLLAVYTGSIDVVDDLKLVGGNDDCSTSGADVSYSCLTISVVPRVTYSVQVDGNAQTKGRVVITLNISSTIAVPANDNFSTAVMLSPVSGLPLLTTGTTFGATLEPREPLAGKGASASVWYRLVAPALSTSVTVC
jgi:hypothetical protein